jgi:hypothetical protein
MGMTDPSMPLFEIRDPALDGEAIIRQVEQRVAQRQLDGAYGSDVTTLGPASLRRGQAERPADAGAADFPGLRDSLAELIARGYLQEPDFTSRTPIAGSLIVAVRRLWNWMSTKWYVRPILWQQSDVNVRSARLVSDLAQWHELDARRIGQLEARLAELEARLVRLEAEDRS